MVAQIDQNAIRWFICSHVRSDSVLSAYMGSRSRNVSKGWKADLSAHRFVLVSDPPVKLSVLRGIGWNEWDPIGLNGSEGGWRRSDSADEYDRYMLRVATRLQSGEPDEALVDYLISIETRHMGLTKTSMSQARAEVTVAAIREHMECVR